MLAKHPTQWGGASPAHLEPGEIAVAALQLREALFRDMLVRFTNVAHTYAASRSMLMKPLGCA